MNREITNIVAHSQRMNVINYYDQCWLTRFKNGHNPVSLAMHMGYYVNGITDSETAKIYTNTFLAQFIPLPDNKPFTIVDLGCGVGGTCIYLANKYPSAEVTGINISSSQVEFARRFSAEINPSSNIQYNVSDYCNTLLPSASYDYVIALESICHAPSTFAVYTEAYRLLKLGGVFAFIDYFELRQPATNEEKNLLEQFRNGWAVPAYINQHSTQLEQVGFKQIHETSITEKIMKSLSRSRVNAEHALKTNCHSDALNVGHHKACIALWSLVQSGVIGYCAVKASKK